MGRVLHIPGSSEKSRSTAELAERQQAGSVSGLASSTWQTGMCSRCGLPIHASQDAATARVMAQMESFRTNTVDTRAAYVAISRARSPAALYTDSRARLGETFGLRRA